MKLTCPFCKTVMDVNFGATLGSAKSERKTAACRENAKKPRPNAKGKKKPRKEKIVDNETHKV